MTINTDNPGLFAIDLTNELEVCVDVLGFSDDDLRRVTANALDASFVDDAAKDDVRRRHFGWAEARSAERAERLPLIERDAGERVAAHADHVPLEDRVHEPLGLGPGGSNQIPPTTGSEPACPRSAAG